MGLIYLVVSPSGGKYVGQTIQKQRIRWNNHVQGAKNENSACYNTYLSRAIRKYGGKNFQRKILQDNIPNEKLDQRQIYWIEYYHSFYKDNQHGYNLTRGGLSGNGEYNKIPVCQYDLDGNIINTYGSISQAVQITGIQNIKAVINGKYFTSGGFYWKIISDDIEHHINIPKKEHGNCRCVCQYTIDGQLVCCYGSVKQAKQKTHINHIECAASGKRKTAGGFIWKYNNNTNEHGKKTIHKYDINHNYICSYDSLKDACEDIGIDSGSSVSMCANGKMTTAYGFIWSYDINERGNCDGLVN